MFLRQTDSVSDTLHRSYILITLLNPEERVTVDYKYSSKIKTEEIRKINPLKTKLRLLYLKIQFVPRSKHFSSRL